jgi:phosphoesterase RecJ-like protein
MLYREARELMEDTTQQISNLKTLIDASTRVLITSHISPDADSVSSVLLFGTTIKHNYPGKKVTMALEETAEGLDFLSGYHDIKTAALAGLIEEESPDLLILLDGNNYNRVSRADGEKIRQFVKSNSIKTVIIDHHEPDGKDESDIYINQHSPAAAQDIYEVLFEHLKLIKPEGYAQTTMTGIYSDTGGFAYDNSRHTETLKLADELLSAGANIEVIKNNLFRISEGDLAILSELAANVAYEDGYTYSFIKDGFINKWLENGKTGAELHKGTEIFVNDYVRNIDGRKWGFIVYRNTLSGENVYSASFRSVSGAKDVAEIAAKLGGGGHKPAAGAKFEAGSVEAAIELVKQTISSVKN